MPENEDIDKARDEGPGEENEPGASLREIEKDEDDALSPPGKSNKALIAGLSIVIFLALFIFFKGEDASPPEDGMMDIQPPASQSTGPALEDILDDTPLAPEPKPGEILIAGEEDEANPEAAEENIVPIPKEELAFFDPLSDTESDRAPSESEEMALLKAEIPKPAPVKPAPLKPDPKPKTVKTKKAADTFTIQLGAFKERGGADKLDDRLRNSGYDSFVLASPNEVYRVRVGSYQSREAAKRVADRIKQTEQLDSFITTE